MAVLRVWLEKSKGVMGECPTGKCLGFGKLREGKTIQKYCPGQSGTAEMREGDFFIPLYTS